MKTILKLRTVWAVLAGAIATMGCNHEMFASPEGEYADFSAAAVPSSTITPTLLPVPTGSGELYRGTGCAVAIAGNTYLGMVPGQGMHPVFWISGRFNQLPMLNMEVIDVNRTGQVVGIHPGARSYPAVWSAAEGLVDMGAPGDPENTRPVGINNHGQVAATIAVRLTEETMFDPGLRATIWNGAIDGWQLLGWPDREPGTQGVDCEAAAINELGWVGGSCRTLPGFHPLNPWRPFIWKSYDPTRIPIPDRFREARVTAMNRAGALAALIMDAQGVFRPAYWSAATGWIEIPIPHAFTHAQPEALNDYGEMLLNLTNGWLSVPAVWSRGSGLILLGTGPAADRGAGVDINNEGVIAGCVGAHWDLAWDWAISGRPATWQLPR